MNVGVYVLSVRIINSIKIQFLPINTKNLGEMLEHIETIYS